ncbi:MAG: EscU/YscU/HrcU family type III secretion system export apparatus switch protein [Georgenia sp.]
MSQQGAGEKTEQATPQRMKKVRADGGLQRSQDLAAWLVVGATAFTLTTVIGAAGAAGREQLAAVERAVSAPEIATAVGALQSGLGSILPTLLPIFAAAVLAGVIGNAAQGGVHIATKRLKPQFKNFDLVKGVKRIFGGQAWWQGLKTLLKTAVVGAVLYVIVSGMAPTILGSGQIPLRTLIEEVESQASTLIIWAVVAGLALAVVDVLVVIRRNRKQTRMSKQEVKDDSKREEGDPHVKGQRRSIQMSMSRNRMMAAVADADVVIVNPTHVAVALRYESGKGAPRVVAKGQGHLAAKIREKATAARVAIVQDVTLARTLHAACEIGQEVPEHLYESVARVLAFVMSLRRRGSAAGVHHIPEPPRGKAHP